MLVIKLLRLHMEPVLLVLVHWHRRALFIIFIILINIQTWYGNVDNNV